MMQHSLYFDDLSTGDVFETPARTITETDVQLFAGLSGDYNPIHTDAEYARQSVFGERIAHGLLGLSVVTGLVARLGIFDGTTLALLGLENWCFKAPLRLGDTLRVDMDIARLRPLADGTRGIVWRSTRLMNQRDEVLQEGTLVAMLKRRAYDGAARGSVEPGQGAVGAGR